ncbi:MAG: hypothetical protein GYA31_02905 [Parcubacteria group bacterium]|nr:hypothetical protein [Parcubacteria group bacterium]
MFNIKIQPKTIEQYIRECESSLEQYGKNGSRPPQRFCKITESGLDIFKAGEIPQIYPEDKLIISLNIAKLLEHDLYNVNTNGFIPKPEDGIYTLCFSVYPVLVGSDISKNDFQTFYQNYRWEIYPQDILNNKTRQNNFICSKPFPKEKYGQISAFIEIPKEEYLNLGSSDTKYYGLKISLVSDLLKNNDDVMKYLNDFTNYRNELTPIFRILNPIK